MLKKPDPSKKSKGVGVGDVSIRTALFTACLFQHDLPFFLAWKVFYYLTLVPPALQKLSVRHAAARVFLEEYQEKVKAVEESIQVLQNLNFKCPISLRSMVVGIFLGIAYAVVTWVVTYFSSNASLARFWDDAALPNKKQVCVMMTLVFLFWNIRRKNKTSDERAAEIAKKLVASNLTDSLQGLLYLCGNSLTKIPSQVETVFPNGGGHGPLPPCIQSMYFYCLWCCIVMASMQAYIFRSSRRCLEIKTVWRN